MSDMKICPHCQKEIPALATFCPECGGRLEDDSLSEEEKMVEASKVAPDVDKRAFDDEMAKRRESYQRQLEERRRRTRRMVPVAVVLAAAAIGGGVFAGRQIVNRGGLPTLPDETPVVQTAPVTTEAETAAAVETQLSSMTNPALESAGAVESTAPLENSLAAESSQAAESSPALTPESTTAPVAANGTLPGETTLSAAERASQAASEAAKEASLAAANAASSSADSSAQTAETQDSRPVVSADAGTSMYTSVNLNVRATPSGDKIGSLSVKDKVQVLDASGDWYKISYDGREAYVWGEYVKKSLDEAESASKAYRESEEKAEESKSKSKKKSKGTDDSYVISSSSKKKIKKSKLEDMSQSDLRLARNEIYARHGAIFSSKKLQKYFEGKSWYTAKKSVSDISWSELNDVEQYNVELISKYED